MLIVSLFSDLDPSRTSLCSYRDLQVLPGLLRSLYFILSVFGLRPSQPVTAWCVISGSTKSMIAVQPTPDVDPTLSQCWASVCNASPALIQACMELEALIISSRRHRR